MCITILLGRRALADREVRPQGRDDPYRKLGIDGRNPTSGIGNRIRLPISVLGFLGRAG